MHFAHCIWLYRVYLNSFYLSVCGHICHIRHTEWTKASWISARGGAQSPGPLLVLVLFSRNISFIRYFQKSKKPRADKFCPNCFLLLSSPARTYLLMGKLDEYTILKLRITCNYYFWLTNWNVITTSQSRSLGKILTFLQHFNFVHN